jgi:hypothetical protein
MRGRTVGRHTDPARASDLRQAKVQNFRVATLGHKNIRRLDVAMHDPLRVSCIQRVRHFDPDLE